MLARVPLGTLRKSRSRKWPVVGLKGDGVLPDSLPAINLIPTNAVLQSTPFSNQKWITILAFSVQLKVIAKPCFAQLLVFFTGKEINVSLPALLQLISPINSSTFFEEKIVNIRSNLGTPVIPDFFRTLDTSSLTCQLVNFSPTSITELSNIANNVIMKSCILDPPPATLLKQQFDLLLPIILKIVNLSLKSGHFPSSLKTAVLSSLLKKANLDHEVLANYRPISNLKVISTIIEKVVTVRLQKYLEANKLNEPL